MTWVEREMLVEMQNEVTSLKKKIEELEQEVHDWRACLVCEIVGKEKRVLSVNMPKIQVAFQRYVV